MSEGDVLIDAHNVSKVFCRDLKRALLYAVGDIGRELLGQSHLRHPGPAPQPGHPYDPTAGAELRRGEFWALRDINFQLRRGECFGLVGSNGAGKSTLLKILNGLIRPDTGSVTVRGRMGALIELGAGFNPVLSGRENIYVNAAVLGLKASDVKRKLDQIIEFAELDKFIDAPLRSYSSGMRVRLGFAVAAHVEPDILLVDEVMAVGDAAFRQKCSARLAELARAGTAFILVTHSAHTQLTLCKRGLYLRQGCMQHSGDIKSVMRAYENEQLASTERSLDVQGHAAGPSGLLTAHFEMGNGERTGRLETGSSVNLVLRIDAPRPLEDVDIALIIRGGAHGASVLEMSTRRDGVPLTFAAGRHEVVLEVPSLGLLSGAYVIKVGVTSDRGERLDYIDGMAFLVIGDIPTSGNEFYQSRRWLIRHASSDDGRSLTWRSDAARPMSSGATQ
jgi:lipopolysaccharide transport system ATP-binding protein